MSGWLAPGVPSRWSHRPALRWRSFYFDSTDGTRINLPLLKALGLPVLSQSAAAQDASTIPIPDAHMLAALIEMWPGFNTSAPSSLLAFGKGARGLPARLLPVRCRPWHCCPGRCCLGAAFYLPALPPHAPASTPMPTALPWLQASAPSLTSA
jgi:hypothetical protein